MKIEQITSANNPKIKLLLSLQKKSGLRRELGLFVVEGIREVKRCLSCGYIPDSLFICREAGFSDENIFRDAHSVNEKCKIFELDRNLYNTVAYRDDYQGIIAEFKTKEHSLDSLVPAKNALMIIVEGIEKPGNLGAILRTADAAGADGVIVCDPLADLYNPNTIRASLGGVFSCGIAVASTPEVIRWLKKHKIKILTAQLQDSIPYYDTDMTGSTAIVAGSEASGLSQEWRNAADKRIRIPMEGICDSLNVSVSASILVFEAIRQRYNTKKNELRK